MQVRLECLYLLACTNLRPGLTQFKQSLVNFDKSKKVETGSGDCALSEPPRPLSTTCDAPQVLTPDGRSSQQSTVNAPGETYQSTLEEQVRKHRTCRAKPHSSPHKTLGLNHTPRHWQRQVHKAQYGPADVDPSVQLI